MKRFFPKSEFTRNALTLITGTSIAQLLPIAAAPILSRMYTPRDWGIFGVFLAMTGVLSIVASGRYELAILLPLEEEDGANLTALAILLAILFAFLLFVGAIFFAGAIADLLGHKAFAPWLFWVPFGVVVISAYQALNYWFNRRQRYRLMAINRVSRSGLPVLISLALGLQKIIQGGLILGSVIGQTITTAAFLRRALREDSELRRTISRKRMAAVAKRYRDFPKFSVPADTINAFSAQMPVFFMVVFFDPIVVGYYNLTQRVLALPLAVVSNAIGDIYKQRASQDFNELGNCRETWVNTFKKLVVLGLIPFTIVGFWGHYLFTFIFGSEWETAGVFSRILAPYFFLSFITGPLGRTLYVAEKQRHDLLWQIGLFLVLATGLYIGCSRGSPIMAVTLFTIAYSGMYVLYIWMSYQFSIRKKHIDKFQPSA